MIIKEKTLYKLLNSVPDVPPETGGILGGNNGIITRFWLDHGNEYDIYFPNTRKINKKIIEWQNESVEFYGIFHSHSNRNGSLSKADINYIGRIMLALENNINTLYFPIVFPKVGIISYCATVRNHYLTIAEDTVKIQ